VRPFPCHSILSPLLHLYFPSNVVLCHFVLSILFFGRLNFGQSSRTAPHIWFKLLHRVRRRIGSPLKNVHIHLVSATKIQIEDLFWQSHPSFFGTDTAATDQISAGFQNFRFVPKITCYVSAGTLNRTHSLTVGLRTPVVPIMDTRVCRFEGRSGWCPKLWIVRRRCQCIQTSIELLTTSYVTHVHNGDGGGSPPTTAMTVRMSPRSRGVALVSQLTPGRPVPSCILLLPVVVLKCKRRQLWITGRDKLSFTYSAGRCSTAACAELPTQTRQGSRWVSGQRF